jgi:hypothetical protein
LAEARASGNHVIALHAIARAERQLELEGRLLGELSESAKVAVGINVTPPPDSPYDYSLLTREELEQLERILSRADELTRAARSQRISPPGNR